MRTDTPFHRLSRLCRARLAIGCLLVIVSAGAAPGRVSLRSESAEAGQETLSFAIDDQPVLTYRFGNAVDLPHFFPILSPSGKLLTVQQVDPYPHHRSLWFADAVRLDGGRRVSFYDALYTRVNTNDPASPFRDRIRHVNHIIRRIEPETAVVEMQLLWEMDLTTPVLDELRQTRFVSLPNSEYFIDLTFTLTASYGDVEFVSDWVHYAWPFVRMHPQLSVDSGGRMTSSTGGVNEAQTNGQPARWIDYSNTIDGATEGLAVFSHPDNPAPHKWLTRDYGTFGPRRPDDRSGIPFTLRRGQTLTQRVGVLVHRGDVQSGRIAERFQLYGDGKL